MNPSVGQIWKRIRWDQYWLIKKSDKRFDAETIAGFDMVNGIRSLSKDFFKEECYLVNPIMCLKCGTARAHLDEHGQFAKGLKCWSCV